MPPIKRFTVIATIPSPSSATIHHYQRIGDSHREGTAVILACSVLCCISNESHIYIRDNWHGEKLTIPPMVGNTGAHKLRHLRRCMRAVQRWKMVQDYHVLA